MSFTRILYQRIELPYEKKKFGDSIDLSLAWLDMGSTATRRKMHPNGPGPR